MLMKLPWWPYNRETLSALLAFREGRTSMLRFDAHFAVSLNKAVEQTASFRWFESPYGLAIMMNNSLKPSGAYMRQ